MWSRIYNSKFSYNTFFRRKGAEVDRKYFLRESHLHANDFRFATQLTVNTSYFT